MSVAENGLELEVSLSAPVNDIKATIATLTLKSTEMQESMMRVLKLFRHDCKRKRKEIEVLKERNRHLEAKQKGINESVDSLMREKTNTEERLYGSFLVILNSKKERIAQLEQQLEEARNANAAAVPLKRDGDYSAAGNGSSRAAVSHSYKVGALSDIELSDESDEGQEVAPVDFSQGSFTQFSQGGKYFCFLILSPFCFFHLKNALTSFVLSFFSMVECRSSVVASVIVSNYVPTDQRPHCRNLHPGTSRIPSNQSSGPQLHPSRSVDVGEVPSFLHSMSMDLYGDSPARSDKSSPPKSRLLLRPTSREGASSSPASRLGVVRERKPRPQHQGSQSSIVKIERSPRKQRPTKRRLHMSGAGSSSITQGSPSKALKLDDIPVSQEEYVFDFCSLFFFSSS